MTSAGQLEKKMSSSWNEATLLSILSNYKIEDLFNAEEFDLFYRWLLEKTYNPKGKSAPKGRKAK